MEPRIQYARTSDGVNIAYSLTGQGPAVLSCIDPLVSHAQLEWSHPVSRLFNQAFARNSTLIRFDPRGCGLSDRVLGETLEDYVLDMEAVVMRTGFQRFGVSANQTIVPAAIVFAARHPDQITRTVFIDGFARWSDLLATPQIQALLAAAEADWILATEAIGFMAFGSGREANKIHGEYIRACVGPEYFQDAAARVANWDASHAARSITAPTLVMKHAGIQFVTMEMTRELAALIPNAQLTLIEGLWADNVEATVQRIVSFLNDNADDQARPGVLPSGTAVILFADIADSTGLTERFGDAAFRAKARGLDGALRAVIRDNAGTPIEGKLLGDGVLAVFTSARQAIEAGLRCGRAGGDAGLPLHLGMHAGDVIREEGNVYGGAVNIAARISGLSAPGEVLVSETVRSLARTSAGVQFEDRGDQALKGVGESVRVWAVREGD